MKKNKVKLVVGILIYFIIVLTAFVVSLNNLMNPTEREEIKETIKVTEPIILAEKLNSKPIIPTNKDSKETSEPTEREASTEPTETEVYSEPTEETIPKREPGVYLNPGYREDSIGSQYIHENIMAYWPYVKQASEKYDFPAEWIYTIILEESATQNIDNGFAIGPMQLEKFVWEDMGYSIDYLFQPQNNIMLGTSYIASFYHKYDENIFEAIGCYCRGEGGWNYLKGQYGDIYDRNIASFKEASDILNNAFDINFISKAEDWNDKFLECYTIYQ